MMDDRQVRQRHRLTLWTLAVLVMAGVLALNAALQPGWTFARDAFLVGCSAFLTMAATGLLLLHRQRKSTKKGGTAKALGAPGRRQALSWGVVLLGWFLVLSAALVWLVSHHRHVGYGAEFRHLLPILLLYVIVFGGIYVIQARRA